MAETLEDAIRERLMSKLRDSSGGGDGGPSFLKHRSESHITVRLWVRQTQEDNAGYANETYDVVVTKSGSGGRGSENPDHLDVDITSETYRHVQLAEIIEVIKPQGLFLVHSV